MCAVSKLILSSIAEDISRMKNIFIWLHNTKHTHDWGNDIVNLGHYLENTISYHLLGVLIVDRQQ